MSHADAVRLQSGAREAVSDEDLDEAAHFSKYAFAAYGYMLYVWSKPLQKCARGCTCWHAVHVSSCTSSLKHRNIASVCWHSRRLINKFSAHKAKIC